MGQFDRRTLRLVEFNVENLFVRLDHLREQKLDEICEKEWQALTSSTVPNKPLASVRRIAAAILDINPDIAMLIEVGGSESLANFSRYFLGDTYATHLLEGNSNRGIDLGYLVKRDLPFTFDLISHKHRSIDFLYEHEHLSRETGYRHLRSAKIESHRFSRDVLELRVRESETEPPVLIVLLVHLKSQLDRDRVDPGGRDRRKAELETLLKIHHEIESEYNGKTPIVLSGDFNGYAGLPDPSSEFASLYHQTMLRDCLEIAGVAEGERFTFQQLHNNRLGFSRQLDYIFLPSSLASRVNRTETWVYRFKDSSGHTQLLPRNFTEKRLLPSDHYPVVLTLNPV